MNKFTQSKSKVYLALGWLFLAALFADGANLDDLLPGTIVVHSDEDNDSQTESQLLVPVSNNAPIQSHSLPQHSQKQETPQPTTPLRIVYDQDSDSLAADPMPVAQSSIALHPGTQVEYESVTSPQILYLLHCTLLI
jgi:hypothetical protein